MPRKNGIQVVESIKAYINNINMGSNVKVRCPLFMFVTAFSTVNFKAHTQKLNIAEVYDKPLLIEQL